MLFQCLEIVNRHVPGSDRQLRGGKICQGARAQVAFAIHQLLRNGIVGRSDLIVFHPLGVVDQTGSQHVGFAFIEIVEELADILPDGDFELDAEVVGKLLRQLIIKTVGFIIEGREGHRRINGADAQFSARHDPRHAVFWFTHPRERRPQGGRQQEGHNADEQIINL